MGIAEESDAVTIMISEESGGVCVAYDGELHRDLSEFGLNRMLETLVVGKNSGDLNETLQLVSAEEENSSLDGSGQLEDK
jgi:diadenylate cyclase